MVDFSFIVSLYVSDLVAICSYEYSYEATSNIKSRYSYKTRTDPYRCRLATTVPVQYYKIWKSRNVLNTK